ncbi:Uncharacterized protein FWK35_00029841, partial [Aphis craccivora]
GLVPVEHDYAGNGDPPKIIEYICRGIEDLFAMGHLYYVDVDLIDFYLKKNGIYNVNIPKYLNNNFIISKMLYDNKHFKKAKKNKIYDLKKKKLGMLYKARDYHILFHLKISKKQIPNEIYEDVSIIDFNVKNFNILKQYKTFKVIPDILFEKFQEFNDNYLFIENKYINIHKIMTRTNISDNFFKQNPVFGVLIQETFDQLILCAKFNIIYNHIDKYHDIQSTLTEYVFKYIHNIMLTEWMYFNSMLRDSKSPNNFFLINNTTSKIQNVNNTILNKIIINIPISSVYRGTHPDKANLLSDGRVKSGFRLRAFIKITTLSFP